MLIRPAFLAATLIAFAAAESILAADNATNSQPVLKVPDGFTIELIAGPPLTERPIVASFDDDGRLYVAESSGSNDPVQKQLAERPHRVVRLEDTNGDGRFDRRTIFADKMMLPEGSLFFDGSLYVAAPPSIWKLTDKDGDGVAEERSEWYQGKTLTGCANDLHGPYAGPDGFLYWCKGAFAEQTHTVNGKEWKTKAAHIFRCRPDGTGFEPVMTGGMDNPVDVAFTADGERILSGTFFHVNPRQDGLIHAVYGGVYGKDHGVLAGHPRTGDLMPILAPLSAAAGSGLERYDSDVFGAEYRENLFLCQFNLRKVSRHILKPAGATYSTTDSDFVSSDFVDFHPTDVVVDADGSLLIIDTGGWYKLCCPTAQLWKPDVFGGIYRVRKISAKAPDDPRGRKIEWAKQYPFNLWMLLADSRFAVRQRASREFIRRSDSSDAKHIVSRMAKHDMPVGSVAVRTAAISRAWVLSQIDSDAARAAIRRMLSSDDQHLRHVALQSISLHRDAVAYDQLLKLARQDESPANRRLAIEALGRIAKPAAVPYLLAAADQNSDRVFQHSLIYALIEIADSKATRADLRDGSANAIAAALIALDQMPAGEIKPADVIPHLGAAELSLRQAASWVVRQHPEWGGELVQFLQKQLDSVRGDAAAGLLDNASTLLEMLVLFSSNSEVQQLLADAVSSSESSAASRELVLRAMAHSKVKAPPMAWKAALAQVITRSDASQLPLALAVARRFPIVSASDIKLSQAIAAVASNERYSLETRIEALSIIVAKRPELSDSEFDFLVRGLAADMPVPVRSAAADAIFKSQLSAAQLGRLCDVVKSAGPLELNRLLKPFDRSTDDQLGMKLIASLKKSPSLASLRIDLLREALAKYGPAVRKGVAELESAVNVDAAAQRKHIEELLPLVAKGDVRRGHAVFYSSKSACASCHRMGAAGGTSGPELSHVGKTRTERDLLEAILYPSLSFVRSYEPVSVTTTDGKMINGVIRDETTKDYVLATGPDQEVRLRRDEVEQIQPSTVSIMPAGLDKQLTPQELADLVTFLKGTAGRQ